MFGWIIDIYMLMSKDCWLKMLYIEMCVGCCCEIIRWFECLYIDYKYLFVSL